MGQQGGFERRQLLIGYQPSEAFLGFHHASSGPAQSHRGIRLQHGDLLRAFARITESFGSNWR
jgi:hypothetical protein